MFHMFGSMVAEQLVLHEKKWGIDSFSISQIKSLEMRVFIALLGMDNDLRCTMHIFLIDEQVKLVKRLLILYFSIENDDT